MADQSFALPLSELGKPIFGVLDVAAAPTAGQGITLDGSGKVPTSALPVPRVFTKTMASGPPSSPIDTDIWIATAVDANGTRWQFQYNAGSSSTFKWEFISGPPMFADVETQESTSSTSDVDLATVGPSLTVARSGDYLIRFGAAPFNTGAGNQNFVRLYLNSSNVLTLRDANLGLNIQLSLGRDSLQTSVPASAVVKLKYAVNGGTGFFDSRWLSVLPVRVS